MLLWNIIVPGKRRIMMTSETPKSETPKQKLLRRRDELRKRLEAIKKDYAQGLDPDFEEQAVQLENAEVLEGIAKATAAELERVERELAKLEHAHDDQTR
jgi:RNA polymerase-binding transcription factor DksA